MTTPVVVIGGGPCGGKSTFLVQARERLEKYGLHPLMITETATELINAGITPAALGTDAFQEHLMLYSLDREWHYKAIADRMVDKKPVIICDRGVLDCAAYMGAQPYASMLRTLGYSRSGLMHGYDLVIHLVTAADGAAEYYTLANNTARKETPEEAKALDARTFNAWLGHPHHVMVDNSTDFAGKMHRALRALSRRLYMPEPTEIERKWRIENFEPSFIPADAVASYICQDYLTCPGPGERRVRMRVTDGVAVYTYTEKRPTSNPAVRVENERIIGHAEYLEFLDHERDFGLMTVEKTRYCFSYSGKVIELDVYGKLLSGLVIAEVELLSADETVTLPPEWVATEVTDDKRYKNRQLAQLMTF